MNKIQFIKIAKLYWFARSMHESIKDFNDYQKNRNYNTPYHKLTKNHKVRLIFEDVHEEGHFISRKSDDVKVSYETLQELGFCTILEKIRSYSK